MVINHNISSMYASRNLNVNEANMADSMQKLSSGQRINKAADDASGLAVSSKLRAQIRGLNMASKNVGDASSFVSTTEGYLEETTSILQRIRELAVQSSNGIYTQEDRAQLSLEVSQLVSEIDRIASQANFNGLNMLTGRFAENGVTFAIGANMDENLTVKIGNMSAESLGIKNIQESGGNVSVASAEEANNALGIVDEALRKVNSERASLGAYQNRMDLAKKGIDNAAENLTAADSRISDTDMANQMVDFTRDQILSQASIAMLSQANSQSSNVLKILQ